MHSALAIAVPSYLAALLNQVAERTGYPLRMTEQLGVGYDCELRLARNGRSYHEVAFTPSFRPYCMHFLLNAAVKTLRVWEAPPEERLVPAAEIGRSLPPQDDRELRRKLAGMPSRQLDELTRFLYAGMSRQLTSMPIDIRVEREIEQQFPEHRREQLAYLQRQVEDLEPTFAPELAEVSPARLYRASTAMNVVLAEEAAEVSRVRIGPRCKISPHHSTGEHLRGQLHAINEPGLAGDRKLTDAWAETLGMRDFYKWVRLDLSDG